MVEYPPNLRDHLRRSDTPDGGGVGGGGGGGGGGGDEIPLVINAGTHGSTAQDLQVKFLVSWYQNILYNIYCQDRPEYLLSRGSDTYLFTLL